MIWNLKLQKPKAKDAVKYELHTEFDGESQDVIDVPLSTPVDAEGNVIWPLTTPTGVRVKYWMVVEDNDSPPHRVPSEPREFDAIEDDAPDPFVLLGEELFEE